MLDLRVALKVYNLAMATRKPPVKLELDKSPGLQRVGFQLPTVKVPDAFIDSVLLLVENILELGGRICTMTQPGSCMQVADRTNEIDPTRLDLVMSRDDQASILWREGNTLITPRRHTPEDLRLCKSQLTGWSDLSERNRRFYMANVRMAKACDYINVLPLCTRPGWGNVGHMIRVAARLGRRVFHTGTGRRLRAYETGTMVPSDGGPLETEKRWGYEFGTQLENQ